MTIAWILYGIVVSALVSIGAECAHVLGRRAGLPTRWVWMSAMGLILFLIAVAPYRQTPSAEESDETSVMSAQLSESSPMRSQVKQSRLSDPVRRAFIVPLERSIALIEGRLPQSANYYLAVLWILASSVLLLVMAGVYIRISRVRRLWDTAILDGVRVRVAPGMGPAIVGLANPEIVVPRSLLERGGEEIHLVITHESEHLRARDPVLLLSGCVVGSLLPWNPSLWWMLRRLQLSVELDCDARLLRNGIAPRMYGSLLIDLAEQSSGFTAGALALPRFHSHLHQRLVAMKPDTPRLSIARSVIISCLSLVSLLAACETTLPTSADVNRMDASSAERAARVLTRPGETVTFMVDGKVVTREAAQAVSRDSIGSISFWKFAGGKPPIIDISTRKPSGDVNGANWRRVPPGADIHRAQANVPPISGGAGLYLINGIRADAATVKAIDPKTIARIDVLKGPGAIKLYNDPLAANGVVLITTRATHAQK